MPNGTRRWRAGRGSGDKTAKTGGDVAGQGDTAEIANVPPGMKF
ncbi:hypothetical protein [Sinorhizobium saheli]|nr:hypothetical protein [Sinorhizobium saheli]